MSADSMNAVSSTGGRPQRPHPKVQERNRAYNKLRDDWIDAHPGADDDAM